MMCPFLNVLGHHHPNYSNQYYFNHLSHNWHEPDQSDQSAVAWGRISCKKRSLLKPLASVRGVETCQAWRHANLLSTVSDRQPESVCHTLPTCQLQCFKPHSWLLLFLSPTVFTSYLLNYTKPTHWDPHYSLSCICHLEMLNNRIPKALGQRAWRWRILFDFDYLSWAAIFH